MTEPIKATADVNRARSEVMDLRFNTAARNIPDGPGMKNFDVTLARAFRLAETKSLQFRAEGTNFFKTVNLGDPGTSANANTFGKVTKARAMRQLQLGPKLVF